ncbi:phosphate ABC transporter substrate-binding protein PstS [Motilibacter sp. E257]|uniref:Phosphate ABC transporter substrate-binding protein PstS n=1 Tax=Motilibacter deserti TaxID=2714956 RepID=A0ABX0GZ44_9ACTN|nr:phosphate ABC transporter substrate-binding protein PstS [Motilibacter deserti]NHC14855.1 phosphate ABC transporter substrate-binding protein PstS [Motilibacter deserti]
MRRLSRVCAAVAVVLVGSPLAAGPAAAESYVRISGSGSSWSFNALNAWIAGVDQLGMRVDYDPSGSSVGREAFKNGTADYGVSEIPYGITDAGQPDPPPTRKYAYMPIVAGGSAFMYNLKVGATRITNLRLSGETLTKIFTGAITQWSDPAIKADNPGLTLPPRRIVPVVRSDGSGSTAQFTTWMASQYPSLWNAYCASAGRSTPCGTTSIYPVKAGSGFTAQSGSLGVAGYVKQETAEGAITYVEYSYALDTNFPVVKVLNKAGYYVEPTADNVAVALTEARINQDESSPLYLTQQLEGVYGNADPRSYPLSSYSYMILPLQTDKTFTKEKGHTLADFAFYFLCDGQQTMPRLGFSPLPRNLVQAGFEQVTRIPNLDDAQPPDISRCNNPTFSSSGENLLAQNAPMPADCDKQGPLQCGEGTGGAEEATPVAPEASGGEGAPAGDGGTAAGGEASAGGAAAGGPATGGAVGAGGTGVPVAGGTGATGGAPGSTGAGGSSTSGGTGAGAAPVVVDPDTGEVISGGGTAGAAGVGASAAGGTAAGGALAGAAGTGGTTTAGGTATTVGAAGAAGGGAVGGGVTQLAGAIPVSAAAAGGWGQRESLMALSALLLFATVLLPPLAAQLLARRKAGSR